LNVARESLLLYAVTDRAWLSSAPTGFDTLERQVEEAILGGATMVQLREKGLDEDAFAALAIRVREIAARHGVPFVVNDDLGVALASRADGLHVGQDDGDVADMRRQLPASTILGVSVRTVDQAVAAERAGADYLGVGALFPTGTKLDAADVPIACLAEICRSVRIPVVAIGGIHAENMRELSGTGIAGVAVVSSLFARPARTRQAATELRSIAATICT